MQLAEGNFWARKGPGQLRLVGKRCRRKGPGEEESPEGCCCRRKGPEEAEGEGVEWRCLNFLHSRGGGEGGGGGGGEGGREAGAAEEVMVVMMVAAAGPEAPSWGGSHTHGC